MCASLKIVNPSVGSKWAGPGPDINGSCWARTSNTDDKQAGSQNLGPCTSVLGVFSYAEVCRTIVVVSG